MRAFGKSFFVFTGQQSSVIRGTWLNLVISIIGAHFFSSLALRLFQSVRKEGVTLLTERLWASVVLFAFFFLAIGATASAFIGSIFPTVPEAIGGGKPPIVHIQFSDNVPIDVKLDFDISRQVEGYSEPRYYGRIVHMDGSSVFLKDVFWYSGQVDEINRDQIVG